MGNMSPPAKTGVLLLIYFTCTVTVQGDARITFSYATETSTDFYKDEPLVLSCQTENKPTGSAYNYGIRFDDGVNAPGTAGCVISPGGVSLITQNLADVTVVDGIDQAACETVSTDPLWSMQLTILITPDLTGYTTACQVKDLVSVSTNVSQQTLTLNAADIKEAPSALEMTVPDKVIEGDEFSVSCAPGEQGVPQSQYEYDILRGGMPIVENQLQGTYTPTKDDRVGISVRCRDTAHPNWRNQADTIATSQTLYAQFIDIGDNAGTDRTIPLNPAYTTNTLTCDFIAHNVADITYNWTSSVVRESSSTQSVLTLDARENVQSGDTEIISCEGTVGELKQSITWTITWNMQATTTPTPITSSPQKDNSVAVGAGVGATVALLVIIGIIVAVIMYRKRKAANGNKYGRDLALNENGESKPKPQGKGRTPSKHSKDSTPLNQQHNDKPEIIYSDVQAINKPHPNTAMVRPHQRADKPPEVEYSSIDFLKTDAQKGKPVVPTGPEYESVERGVHGEFNKPKQPRAPPRVSVPRNQAPPPPRSSPPGDLDI